MAKSRSRSRRSISKLGEDSIRFTCIRCNTRLKVPQELAGRYIDCPKCKERTPVPASQEEAIEAEGNYVVVGQAYEVPRKCTHCGTRIKKGSILCVNCGFHYTDGEQLYLLDDTVHEGDVIRGRPAMKAMIIEAILLVGLLDFLFFEIYSLVLAGDNIYVTVGLRGLLLASIFYLSACLLKHFSMWNDYRKIPILDVPTRQEDDRTERLEARKPFGERTKNMILLSVFGGVALSFVLWGRLVLELP